MDGFQAMTMAQAAPLGDLFITVTGCEDVITPAHFINMKEGAILCNAGHFDCEVNVAALGKMAAEVFPARNNIMGYRLANGHTLYVIGEGRLVNLAAGDGHPAEIMDMSFAIQALSARYLVEHKGKLEGMLHNVPQEIDEEVARRKLADWGIEIDRLTPEQYRYLYGE